jgi:hypothetical protein
LFDNKLAVSRSNGEIYLFDISNPVNPQQLVLYQAPSNVYDVEIHENLLFVLTQTPSQDLIILDISDPTLPSLLASLDLPDRGSDAKYDPVGNRLYIASRSNAQEIFVVAPQ